MMRVATTSASARPFALMAPTFTGAVQDLVQCIWCGKDIYANEPVIEIGGAMMYDRPCRDQYEAEVYGLDFSSTPDRVETPDVWCEAALADQYSVSRSGRSTTRVLDFARSEDRAIIERIIRIPVGVE